MGVKKFRDILNKSASDPTQSMNVMCRKNVNRITSLLAYRAYELTQVGAWIHFSVMTSYQFVTNTLKYLPFSSLCHHSSLGSTAIVQ